MPRSCTICEHPEREAIDAALVGGTTFSALSREYRASEDALGRHKNNHLPAKLVMAQKAKEVAQANSLLEQVQSLQGRALSILDKAEAADDLGTALRAIAQARGNLELLGKLAGELQQEGTVNIHLNAEWIELRALIFHALQPHPQALSAVRVALQEVKTNGNK